MMVRCLPLLRITKAPPFLSRRDQSLHQSPIRLQWKNPRPGPRLTRPELLDCICHHLTLRRISAVEVLPFDFSDDLLDAVLRKLRLNPSACLEFFRLASKQQNYRPSVKPYCKIVHILSRARMFDETRSYLNQLVDLCTNSKHTGVVIWDDLVRTYREFSFSPTVFDMILKVYAKRGFTKNALHVFDNMSKCGRVPSLQSCNSLLSSLVRNGDFHTVVAVYDHILRIGIVPDVYTCTIMVDAYCKNGKVGKAIEFVNDMGDLGLEPNEVTYHCLLNGYVVLGDIRGFEGVLDLMDQRGILMNGVTYTLLIKSYCKLNRMDKAESVLRAMIKEPSLPLDGHAYGVLIDAYCQCSRIDEALRVKAEMLGSGITMNLFICNSIINGYCKLGQIHQAEQFMMNLGSWNLKPDSYSYHTLINGYCKLGLMVEAFSICDKMLNECIAPSVVTYNTLLKGFCIQGVLEDALRLWHLMLKRGVSPNEISYGIMLDGFLKMKNLEGALILWKHVLSRGFVTTVTYNTMINGLINMGEINEAERVLEKMKQLQFSLDGIAQRNLSDGNNKVEQMQHNAAADLVVNS